MKIIECQQGGEEWLAARAGLATGSAFDAVLAKGKEGKTRSDYMLRLALERLGAPPVATFESFATRQGKEREPFAISAFEHRTREIVRRVGFCRHDKLECGASPDGLIGDDEVLEVKCPIPSTHLVTLRERRLPTTYTAQVQGELWITGRKLAKFVSFNPDFPERHRLVIVDVPRDEAYIDRLRVEVTLFLRELREQVAELEAMP